MSTASLLEQRKRAKKQKPDFVVKASHFSARIKRRWRNPRGIHSPIRQKKQGKPAMATIGYRSPTAVRGLHSSGLKMIVVSNANDIMAVNPATEGAVIASGVGGKKRLLILAAAQQRKIRVLNVRDIPKTVTAITDAFTQRVASRKKKMTEKTVKAEEKKKKAEEKKKKDAAEAAKAAKSGSGKESGSVSVEDTIINEQEKQKEIVDKTIIKRT